MPTEPLLPSGWTLGPAGRLVIGDVSPYWYITINKVIIYKVIHLCILSISNISITYIFLNVIDIGDDLYSEVSLYLGDFFVVYDLWYIYIYWPGEWNLYCTATKKWDSPHCNNQVCWDGFGSLRFEGQTSQHPFFADSKADVPFLNELHCKVTMVGHASSCF